MIKVSKLIYSQTKSNWREIANLALSRRFSNHNNSMMNEEQKQNPDAPQKFDYSRQEEEIHKAFEAHERNMMAALTRVKEYTLKELANQKKTMLDGLKTVSSKPQKSPEDAFGSLLNITLPLFDNLNHLQEKLNNVVPAKQLYVNIYTDLTNKIKLDGEQRKQGKKTFDLICDYEKRKKLGLDAKDLYDDNMMRYLVLKTFKKSAGDIFTLASGYYLKDFVPKDKPLVVKSIGGGPASDLCGLLSAVIDLNLKEIECEILDFNAEGWASVVNDLLPPIIKANAKKLGAGDTNIKVKWTKFDMCFENESQLIPKADIFTIAWALNESNLNVKIWEKIFAENPGAYFFFVEGERGPLEALVAVLGERKFDFNSYESPRRLAVLPKGI